MEALVAFLQSTLGLRARQGWIFLLIGAAMLTLLELELLPKQEIAGGWLAAFWLSAVSGAVILAVSAGYAIYGDVDKRRKLKAKDVERERLEADALKSAEILRGHEAKELLARLLVGEQRFTTPDATGLRNKNILRYVHGNVYMVVDSVWNDRERLVDILQKRLNG